MSVTQMFRCISPISCVPKKNLRLVVDLRLLDTHICSKHFQHEDFRNIKDIVTPCDKLVTVNSKNGFHHIPFKTIPMVLCVIMIQKARATLILHLESKTMVTNNPTTIHCSIDPNSKQKSFTQFGKLPEPMKNAK